MSHSLEEVAANLGIDGPGQQLCTGWDEAMSDLRPQAAPFLESAFIYEAGRVVGLTNEMLQTLVAFASQIAADESLAAFFWYCRHRVLHDPTLVLSWEEPWPPLDGYLGADAGQLNALVMLSAVPEMQQTYRRLGIPSDIVQATVADLRLWMETDLYYLQYGRWGITPWIARWLCKHWQGKLLQLGRLQFSLGQFNGPLRTYRHLKSGKVIALSEPGIPYGASGDIYGTCCGPDPGTWISILSMTADDIEGNPILPNAKALCKTVRLSFPKWEPALVRGDNVLIFHVPVGPALSFADCGESFRKALDVFPRYYPTFSFAGFSTSSWLMDPRLDGLLPPESNIVRMQREVYLYPGVQGGNDQIRNRVFGWGVSDINAIPWTTSLQKQVGAYLNEGGHFHGGHCFLLREDLRWGSQAYRSMAASQNECSNAGRIR